MPALFVIHALSGEMLERLTSFESASEARKAAALQAGYALTWTRTSQCWEAREGELVYQVAADDPLPEPGASKGTSF